MKTVARMKRRADTSSKSRAAITAAKLAATMSKQQGRAMLTPTLLGGERRGVLVIEARKEHDRHLHLSIEMGGGPELVGPCWRSTVSFGSPGLLVKDWTLEHQEEAKLVALRALRGVGFGERIDVKVGETQLDVWKLCTNVEAAVAGHAAGKVAEARAAAKAAQEKAALIASPTVVYDDPAGEKHELKPGESAPVHDGQEFTVTPKVEP